MRYKTRLGMICFIYCMALMVLFDVPPRSFAQQIPGGGGCEYKKYRGKAEIVSITNRPGYPEQYEVKFLFHAEGWTQERPTGVEGTTWVLLSGSAYPKADFLTKYGVEVGKFFDCYMTRIIKGTCIPVYFEFPTIDRAQGTWEH
ncbi:MAG: hypothetical protein ABSC04_05400 [Syntrophobacteraceae bacterium]|jgi:hypothetical protein